jgi:hypothetical protein
MVQSHDPLFTQPLAQTSRRAGQCDVAMKFDCKICISESGSRAGDFALGRYLKRV